ncbi:MAG TPA: tRNA dihydrouridine(20/20a) synthase DusA [Porticoccaceae bacterium]|nr:tRNA dihydrouridine(20/20a) synthase DusA [Porticoccaceae bacterium]
MPPPEQPLTPVTLPSPQDPARYPDRRLSVAPMMDYTDHFCRYFLRLISRHTLLYTEMVTTGALLFGDSARFLAHDHSEHPVALQLGGSDGADLAACARMAERAGFDEVNLNCGCPSDRVQNGNFGACLMKEPRRVADGVAAMVDAVGIPVTVKNRIGVDELDSYDYLRDFVGVIAERGCDTFIVHARKAWLKGLSPKQNREIPPLQYPLVHRLKRDFPHLEIIINGGITTLDDAEVQLAAVDGVMIGREAYHNPWLLADVDRRIYGAATGPITREAVLEAFIPFVQGQIDRGVRLGNITRHILGLYNGEPGARKFRRFISENAHRRAHDVNVLWEAMAIVDEARSRVA